MREFFFLKFRVIHHLESQRLISSWSSLVKVPMRLSSRVIASKFFEGQPLDTPKNNFFLLHFQFNKSSGGIERNSLTGRRRRPIYSHTRSVNIERTETRKHCDTARYCAHAWDIDFCFWICGKWHARGLAERAVFLLSFFQKFSLSRLFACASLNQFTHAHTHNSYTENRKQIVKEQTTINLIVIARVRNLNFTCTNKPT